MAKWCKIFIVLFFLPAVLHSQDQNIKFEHITTEQGLSNPIVECILKDRFGLMWFGTTDGLNKYDGYTFTVYKNIPNDSTSLAHNWINCILEDHNGQLWVGTGEGGLYLYNRSQDNFKRYQYQRDDTTTLATNSVISIFEDFHEGNYTLWVNTLWGINRYNPQTDDFKRYYPEKGSYVTNGHAVLSMAQDSSGRLWAGTQHEGLFYYDRKKDNFVNYEVPNSYRRLFLNRNVSGIIADTDKGVDRLWVGTRGESGLYCVYPDNSLIELIKTHDEVGSLSGLYLDKYRKNDVLWISSENGLSRLDISSGQFIRFRHNPSDKQSISSDGIFDIYRDNTGILWIATRLGISKLNPFYNSFGTIRPDYNYPNSLSHREVGDINQTGSGDNTSLWIGTANGLNRYEPKSGKFSHFYHDPDDPNSLTSSQITKIRKSVENGREVLWVATTHGFNRVVPQSGKIKRFYLPDQDFTNANSIWSLCIDNTGNLWLGSGNALLYRYDPRIDKFTRFRGFRRGINTLHINSSGYLWIGTLVGLVRFNIDDLGDNQKNYQSAITWYKHNENNPHSISSDDVTTIYEDSRNTLWFGTSNGLNKFDPDTKTFTRFGKTQGMPGAMIAAILEDDEGNLWISTDHGITKFNQDNNSFKNYDVGDGLQGNMFWFGAFKNQDGEMYFGGINGLTYFHPQKINENNIVPPVMITGFNLFNKLVVPSHGSVLKEHISITREIVLTHKQSVFSFEFAALDYANPQKNQYAYKMQGVDPDWVYTDASRRFATYTNLDPGDYVFRVKGSNNDGIWNKEGTSIKMIILPPWWRTNWAYTVYALFILSLVLGIWRFQTNRLKIRQQLEMEHFEAGKLREVDQMKSRFFANISHEFRTPLTLIQGPVKEMLEDEFNEKRKRDYQTILRYSDRLLNLINQILDLSKLESGRMVLRTSTTNITQYLKGIVQSFGSLAERKKVTLKFKTDEKSIIGLVDRDKLEKIVTNLLSNAFKFTPEGGRVEVGLSLREDSRSEAMETTKQSRLSERNEIASPASRRVRNDSSATGGIQIEIFNSGAGIPPDQLDKIFDRFYQADESYTKDSEGSGIGLALTKELVEAHHGEIGVESELNKGTTFTVWLPIEKEHFKPEEIVEEHIDVGGEQRSPLPIARGGEERRVETIEAMPLKQPAVAAKSAPLLLIVEDNPDVTIYISSFLEKDYRIITAENGKAGLKKALDKSPDLIISDVMMPVMDGFELCRKLKSDERISHIPLILLTARADMESKLEGLEFGADDYVTKPFDAKELCVRSKNLLEQRRRLQEHFKRKVEFQPSEITVNSMDEKFMHRAIELIEQHMDDTDFSAEKFSREIGMSRRHLNRKLHSLTNYPARDFIRTIRLKRAAQLLKKNSDPVTQIAYQVGFSNPSYFTECFKNQFGMAPFEYASRHS